jgi:hypothetical protein
LIASSPPFGAEGVDRRVEILLVFDRPILPRSVTDDTVSLRSGRRQVSIVARADPLLPGIAITLRQLLDPEVRYEVRVAGARDLDGHEATPVSIHFFTGTAVSDPRPLPVPPWSDIAPLFASACGRCHGGRAPVLGLDLSSAEGIRRTALGVSAVEVAGMRSGATASLTAGLLGLPRIAVLGGVGRPEESYLVYKLIGDPHVVGDPMPPPVDGGPSQLGPEAIRAIAWWIAAGAPTE